MPGTPNGQSTATPRNPAACDQCHAFKYKCIPMIDGCGRCKRLSIPCTSQRIKHKRGRKPASDSVRSPLSSAGSQAEHFPVLDCLHPYVKNNTAQDVANSDQVCTTSEACQLLDHFYTSPNEEFQTSLIRRCRLLSTTNPRITSPALLFSILCVACYMPKADNSILLPEISRSRFITIRRALLSKTLLSLRPVLVGEVDPSLDEAITIFMLSVIGCSENDTQFRLPHWLNFMKLCLRKLKLHIEPAGVDEEEKEERRRLWWAGYTIDRHSAFSFNQRPATIDLECQTLRRPCPDSIWLSDMPLEEYVIDSKARPRKGINYSVEHVDLMGLFLPLSSILGDILEYHVLRQHATFGSHVGFLAEVRQNIERNLQEWHSSLMETLRNTNEVERRPDQTPGNGSKRTISQITSDVDDLQLPRSHPSYKPLLYSCHIWHCLHILLFGTMDIVQMYGDSQWQASRDFVQAGEHALACAKLAGSIMEVDPHLHSMYRYFGTYLLQSSFIFLILAQKLGKAADDLILDNCTINLRVLDTFVGTVNIGYQRTFARVLRETLQRRLYDDGTHEDRVSSTADVEIDPALYRYRWIAGYTGLWNEDMGVAPAANIEGSADGPQNVGDS